MELPSSSSGVGGGGLMVVVVVVLRFQEALILKSRSSGNAMEVS